LALFLISLSLLSVGTTGRDDADNLVLTVVLNGVSDQNVLGNYEADAVLSLIVPRFSRIPLKPGHPLHNSNANYVGTQIANRTYPTPSRISFCPTGAGSKCSVFLRDGNDFAAMNEVYAEFFGDQKPARTTVEAKFAVPEMKVEIDCIAYKPK
jgi:hypothetical protein